MDRLLICVFQAQSIKHFPRLSNSTEELPKLLRAPPSLDKVQGGGDSYVLQFVRATQRSWKILRYLET